MATRKLRSLGVPARNMRGGLQAGIGRARPACAPWLSWEVENYGPNRIYEGQNFQAMPLYKQWIAFTSGFIVKTTYMALALVIVWVLWRRRSPDLVALRWAFIFFYLGEAFCAGNYLFFDEQSFLFEHLHSYGMVLCFAFVAFAFFEGLDRRVIHFSDYRARCAALALCGPCAKHVDAPCGLRRLFLWLTPLLLLAAIIPLTAPLRPVSYNSMILGSFYSYTHYVVHQLYEIRLLPVVAMALFAVTFFVLRLGHAGSVGLAKILFSAGVGALGFSLFRLFLFTPFQDDMVWFVAWEEFTELLFTLGVLFALWIFRHGLREAGNAQDEQMRTVKEDPHFVLP